MGGNKLGWFHLAPKDFWLCHPISLSGLQPTFLGVTLCPEVVWGKTKLGTNQAKFKGRDTHHFFREAANKMLADGAESSAEAEASTAKGACKRQETLTWMKANTCWWWLLLWVTGGPTSCWDTLEVRMLLQCGVRSHLLRYHRLPLPLYLPVPPLIYTHTVLSSLFLSVPMTGPLSYLQWSPTVFCFCSRYFLAAPNSLFWLLAEVFYPLSYNES